MPSLPDGYATHLPVLLACLRRSTGAILELGSGLYSTPLVHAFAVLGRYARTIETEAAWGQRILAAVSGVAAHYHHDFTIAKDTADCALRDRHWSLVIVDHAAERRAADLRILRPGNPGLVLVHDSESVAYGAEPILREFAHRYDFTGLGTPHTTVVSDVDDLAWLHAAIGPAFQSSPALPQVCSWKRSGTHLAMALLWQNFEWPDLAAEISTPEGMSWQDTGQRTAAVPWAKLFGGHQPRDATLDPARAIYVLRDPRDCFYSAWRSFTGETKQSLDTFVEDRQIEAWKAHVLGYLGTAAMVVRYEDLLGDWRSVLIQAESRFRLVRKAPQFQPVDKPVGWSPGEGKAGYADRYEPETLERFRRVLGDACFGYTLA